MGVNKVEFDGDVLIDLTEDTVTPATLGSGATAHNAAGDVIEGMARIVQALTASRALVSDASGNVAVSDVTATELSYLDNAKSNLQAQIDGIGNVLDGVTGDLRVLNGDVNDLNTKVTNHTTQIGGLSGSLGELSQTVDDNDLANTAEHQALGDAIGGKMDTPGSQTRYYVFAAPSSGAGVPSFRKLVAGDLPVVTIAKGGTGVANLKITYGVATATFSSTQANQQTINFGYTYTNAPYVATTQIFDQYNICVRGNEITTTGFKLRVPQMTSSGTRQFSWIAIGV